MTLDLETTDTVDEGSSLAIRPASAEYISLLREQGSGGSAAQVKDIRGQHHRLARLLAYGMRPAEVARRTGVSMSTMYRLRNSPAFENLELHYAKEFEDKGDEIFDRMEFATIQLLDIIQDKLGDPEEVEDTSIKEVSEVLTKLLDRIGHSAVRRTEERKLHVHASANVIAEMKGRVNARAPKGERVVLGQDGPEGALVEEASIPSIFTVEGETL